MYIERSEALEHMGTKRSDVLVCIYFAVLENLIQIKFTIVLNCEQAWIRVEKPFRIQD